MIFTRKTEKNIGQSYTSNPALQGVRPDWKGTPLDARGRFLNPEYPSVLNYGHVFKYLTERNPQRSFKKKDTWRIGGLKNEDWLSSGEDMIVWLGHASFFIQLSGIRILIDPVFGSPPGIRRYSEMPVDPRKLLKIDYILVSHAHYDHCDKISLRLLAAQNPQARVLCGLKLDQMIGKWVRNPIQSAGWYQQFEETNKSDLTVTFLPSRHWANRSVFDLNTTLWGGFMIQGGGSTTRILITRSKLSTRRGPESWFLFTMARLILPTNRWVNRKRYCSGLTRRAK